MKSIEVSGKNVDQAIEIGLFKMEAKREDVRIIVLEEGGLFNKAKVKLVLNNSDEPQTKIEEMVDNFLKSTGLNIYGEVVEEDDKITINLSGSEIGILIGKRGDVLDALQYLFSQIINRQKPHNEYKRVVIDSEGYRNKREETLRMLGQRLANKVVKEGKPTKLEPMNAAERRIIHTSLQSKNNVTTTSKGEEPNRYVIISPASLDKKEYKNKKAKNNNKKQNLNIENRAYND